MARTKQTARKSTHPSTEQERKQAPRELALSIKMPSSKSNSNKKAKTAEVDPATQVEGVANLYRHDCPSYNCCPSRWSRYSNHDSEQAWIAKDTVDIPIVHRQQFSNKTWVTQDFTVQDPTMRAFLQHALANYQDFDLELVNWTFTPPFSPLVHRWDQLNEVDHHAEEASSPEPVQQLMKFLEPLLKTSVEALLRTRKTGKVDFDNLWHIFPPGGHALTTLFGQETVCRITKHERFDPCRKPPYWVISLEYLDWNGETSGYTDTDVTIGYFEGFRHVVSLPVYPLSFHKNAAEVQARMIDRGRKFEKLRGYNYQTCNGTKVLLQTEKPELRPVSGRVVVDAFAYYRNNDIVKLSLKPLEGEQGDKASHKRSRPRADSSSSSHSDSWESGNMSEGPAMKALEIVGSAKSRVELKTHLTDEQCLLATPWLRGLDMQMKEWAYFNVDELSAVEWNDAAFDHLVLPGNEKHLSWNFVENQALAKDSFDDFVQDKGRGIIILMYGPPGVGKTFTAEAVAERARVPLYSMSAGTLGTDPAEVEKTLVKALDLCELWNAMLLLDEADVFLTARTNSDLLRNELVAIFLTKLEYYPGICFLTTNRISSLDHAVQSRVDLFLPYADLTEAARRQVWQHFMARTGQGKFDISATDLDTLAKARLNGREIKNLVKSAHLLSLKDGGKIGMDCVYGLAQNRIRALEAMAEQ